MESLAVVAAGTAVAIAFLLAQRHAREAAAPRPPRRISGDREVPDHAFTERMRAALGALPAGVGVEACAYFGEGGSGLRLVVRGAARKLVIAPEHEAGDLETGDATLDPLLHVNGPPALVRALLDAATRRALLTFHRTGARIEDGALRVSVPAFAFGRAVGTAREAVALVARLATPDDLAERLAANALNDPLPAVRLANLRALIREFPDAPGRTATLRKAVARGNPPAVRVAAGRALGEEARPHMKEVVLDRNIEDEHAADAMHALGPLSAAEAATLLPAVAPVPGRADRPWAARACLQAIGRGGDPGAIPLIADYAVLGAEQDILLAAVQALQAIGTAAAILPLKEAAGRHRGELRTAARIAVADVQSRLAGTPGELSLAEGETGQVSIAADADGRLSLPDHSSGGK